MGVETNGGFVKVAVSRAVRLLSVSVKRVSSVYADAANQTVPCFTTTMQQRGKSDQKRQGLLDNESWQLQ